MDIISISVRVDGILVHLYERFKEKGKELSP